MRAIFRCPGSKWSLAGWIISHFPAGYEKMVYLEPFCGSGAVFFNKEPGAVETINDMDGDVVNLFRVLRESPEELRRALELTPYSREEYDLSFMPADEPIEKARRFMVRTNQAIGAKLGAKCGWRNHKQREIGGTACKWGGITDTVDLAAQRLRGSTTNLVQIEHMDALELIARYNRPDVLMYIDPPYLMGTRKSGRLYAHELDDGQHRELLKLLKESRAKIVLSGYQSELYDRELCGWYKDSAKCQTTSGEFAREVIWINYEPCGQMRLYDEIGEMELKLCPFCGREAVLEELCGTWYVRCTNCGIGSSIFSDPQKAVERWNRRYEPPNEPLTLKELREMGGEPYWHVGLQKASPPPHWNILDPFYAQHIEDYGYERRWLAYRRKPKETQT